MNDFNIILQSDVEPILDEGYKYLAEEGENINQQLWKQVVNAASQLKQVYEKQLGNEQRYKNTSKKSVKNFAIANNLNYNTAVEQSQVYQDYKKLFQAQTARLHFVYPAAFTFDKILAEYRGQVPKEAAFVIELPNKIPVTYLMSLEELYSKSTIFNRLFLENKDLQGEYSTLEELLKQYFKDEEYKKHLETAQSAYIGTMNRLNVYLKKAKKTNHKAMLLMWQKDQGWQLARVAAEGDVKEGYVGALMAEHENKCLCSIKEIGDGPYFSHILIENFFNNFISKTTSLAAIIEEDIYSDIYGIQYAVKSQAASLPSLNQYITVAEEVLKRGAENPMSKKEIENYLRQTFKEVQKDYLITNLNQLTQEETQTVLQGISNIIK